MNIKDRLLDIIFEDYCDEPSRKYYDKNAYPFKLADKLLNVFELKEKNNET